MSLGSLIRITGLFLWASAATSHAETCLIDAAKANPWSRFDAVQSKVPPPIVATYKKCGRTLTYVAVEHSNDPKGPTFARVKTAMAHAEPKILVLEGFPESLGENAKPLIDYAGKVANTPADAEPYLAVRLAQQKNAKFIGGEPDDRDILAAVKLEGWRASDLFGLYVLRLIEEWTRAKEINGPNDPRLNTAIASYAPIFAKDAGAAQADIADVATRDGFRAWYKRTNGLDFDTNYRAEDAWPPSKASDRKSNALIATISDIRDRHILSVIDKSLQAFGDVMVVYGASHYDIEAPALIAAYGPPQVER